MVPSGPWYAAWLAVSLLAASAAAWRCAARVHVRSVLPLHAAVAPRASAVLCTRWQHGWLEVFVCCYVQQPD